jgi:hypothetical protein
VKPGEGSEEGLPRKRILPIFEVNKVVIKTFLDFSQKSGKVLT